MITQADARHIPLPDASVHCVVTSVPYWGLRRYAGDHAGLIGLERTLDEWIGNLVECFREVRRVLRPDGVCWLNCGDAWCNSDKWGGSSGGKNTHSAAGGYSRVKKRNSLQATVGPTEVNGPNCNPQKGLKPKDLLGLGHRLVFALQADGWWWRDRIVWAKAISFDPAYSGSVMPESVTDRTTRSFEDVFLLTKSARYFWDGDAERELDVTGDPRRPYTSAGAWELDGRPAGQRHGGQYRNHSRGRNLRSVWAINPEPFTGAICRDCWRYWPGGYHREKGYRQDRVPWATGGQHCRDGLIGVVPGTKRFCSCGSERLLGHYATFPTRLVEACVRLGSSERGACGECGKAWRREVVVDKTVPKARRGTVSYNTRRTGYSHGSFAAETPNYTSPRRTLGWQPTCRCGTDPVPCLVLDPFAGAGTTVLEARRLGRRAVGLDLSLPYCRLARARIEQDRPLMAAHASPGALQKEMWID